MVETSVKTKKSEFLAIFLLQLNTSINFGNIIMGNKLRRFSVTIYTVNSKSNVIYILHLNTYALVTGVVFLVYNMAFFYFVFLRQIIRDISFTSLFINILMVKILIVFTLTWTKTPLLVLVIVGSGCTPWPSPATRSCTSGVQSASVFEWEDAQSSIARFDLFK